MEKYSITKTAAMKRAEAYPEFMDFLSQIDTDLENYIRLFGLNGQFGSLTTFDIVAKYRQLLSAANMSHVKSVGGRLLTESEILETAILYASRYDRDAKQKCADL